MWSSHFCQPSKLFLALCWQPPCVIDLCDPRQCMQLLYPPYVIFASKSSSCTVPSCVIHVIFTSASNSCIVPSCVIYVILTSVCSSCTVLTASLCDLCGEDWSTYRHVRVQWTYYLVQSLLPMSTGYNPSNGMCSVEVSKSSVFICTFYVFCFSFKVPLFLSATFSLPCPTSASEHCPTHLCLCSVSDKFFQICSCWKPKPWTIMVNKNYELC